MSIEFSLPCCGDGTFDHVGDTVLILLVVHVEGMGGDIHIQ